MFLGLLHVRLELGTEPLNRNQMRTGGKKKTHMLKGCTTEKYASCCGFSHLAYWLPTRKTILHGGQHRLWSAEQGKEHDNNNKSDSAPLHPDLRCSYRGKGKIIQTNIVKKGALNKENKKNTDRQKGSA